MAISAYAVSAVRSTFEIRETDSKVQFARRVFGRALTNGALTIAASVETVVLALLTVAALPLYYLHNRSFNSLTTRTKLAGRATAEAFLGIVGWKMKESKSPVTPSKTEAPKPIQNRHFNSESPGLVAKIACGILIFKGVKAAVGYAMKNGGPELVSRAIAGSFIGNLEYFNSENVILAANIACRILIAGAALATVGYAIENAGAGIAKRAAAGSFVGNLGNSIKIGGQGFVTAGKYTAYTVLVPGYILGYQAPKWAVTVALPETVRLFNTYIFNSTSRTIEWLAAKGINGMVSVYDHILKPIVKITAQFFHDYLLLPLIDTVAWAADRFVDVLQFVKDYVFIPQINIAIKVTHFIKAYLVGPAKQALAWIGNRIVDVLVLSKDYIFVPLIDLAIGVVKLFNSCLLNPAVQILEWIANRVVDVLVLSIDYLFVPMINLAIEVVKLFNSCLLKPAVQVLEWIANRTVDVLVFGRDYILTPVAAVANKVLQIAWNYLIEPTKYALMWIGNRIVDLLQSSNDYLLMPVVNAIAKVAAFFLQNVLWITNNILQPTALTIGNLAYSGSAAIASIYGVAKKDILSLFGIETESALQT